MLLFLFFYRASVFQFNRQLLPACEIFFSFNAFPFSKAKVFSSFKKIILLYIKKNYGARSWLLPR